MLTSIALTAALSWAPCDVPEYRVATKKIQILIDNSVHKHWEPKYHRYRCVAMAQILAESSGDIKATSSVGAKGLAQFMPATWNEVVRKHNLPMTCSPYNPKCAIEAYSLYSMHLIRYFKAPRPDGDRMVWMVTAYHAGAGNADKAQALCDGARIHAKMSPCLPSVINSKNAKHDAIYVRKIKDLYKRMTGWILTDENGKETFIGNSIARKEDTLPSIAADCA